MKKRVSGISQDLRAFSAASPCLRRRRARGHYAASLRAKSGCPARGGRGFCTASSLAMPGRPVGVGHGHCDPAARRIPTSRGGVLPERGAWAYPPWPTRHILACGGNPLRNDTPDAGVPRACTGGGSMRSGGDPHARGRDNPTWRLERWKHELATRMRARAGSSRNAACHDRTERHPACGMASAAGIAMHPRMRAGEFSRRIPLFFRAFPAIMAV